MYGLTQNKGSYTPMNNHSINVFEYNKCTILAEPPFFFTIPCLIYLFLFSWTLSTSARCQTFVNFLFIISSNVQVCNVELKPDMFFVRAYTIRIYHFYHLTWIFVTEIFKFERPIDREVNSRAEKEREITRKWTRNEILESER